MKKISSYLHLYVGCMMQPFEDDKSRQLTSENLYDNIRLGLKPILRSLQNMTEAEAHQFVLLCLNSPHAPKHFQTIESEEIDFDLIPNDSGLMLDNNVDVYIQFSCRCIDGYIVIMNDGRIGISDDQDASIEDIKPVDDIFGKVQWLLSQGFDLFGLIKSELALENANRTIDI